MNETLIRAFDACRSRQASITRSRRNGNYGIAVETDRRALEWQRLNRIADKCYARISAKLTAADALAVAIEAIIDGIDDEWHPAFRDEMLTPDDHKLITQAQTAMRQYQEAGK